MVSGSLRDGFAQYHVDAVVVEDAEEESGGQPEHDVDDCDTQGDTSSLDRHPAYGGGRQASSSTLDGLSYRLSLRYSVEGSIPSTSAARLLLPPSTCRTQVI